MARKANMTRSVLIDRLSACFLDAGYEGASLSRLARAAGLAKATLYHHFPNGKSDMAAAVLARAGQRLQVAILAPLFDQTRPPAARMAASLDGVLLFYSGDIPACTMNTLLMGEGRDLFAPAVGDGFQAWRRGLAGVLEALDRPEPADFIIDRIQGALVRCRAAGNRAPLEAAVADLKTRFLPAVESPGA